MTRTLALCALLVATVAATLPSHAGACMPGFAHPQKSVIVFWHDGVEILIWRSRVTPGRGGGLEDIAATKAAAGARNQMAWVLAVPSAPLSYHVVENEAFDNTLGWVGGLRAFSRSARGGGGIGEGGLEVGETVRVGEYDITPIRGEDDESDTAASLNQWLERHRFPPVNAEAAQAYASEGATFLAVKVRLPRRASSMTLRPLGIAFRSEHVVIPVRLSVDDSAFALNVTLFASRVPQVDGDLSHNFEAAPMNQHGILADDRPMGRATVVPYVALPAAMRNLIRPIADEVPGVERILEGSLALSQLGAQPVQIVLGQPDPTIRLGEPVPRESPATVHFPIEYDEQGEFRRVPYGAAAVVGTPPESGGEPAGESTAATTRAETATPPASSQSDESTGCGACTTGPGRAHGFAPALIALGLVGLLAVRRRRPDCP